MLFAGHSSRFVSQSKFITHLGRKIEGPCARRTVEGVGTKNPVIGFWPEGASHASLSAVSLSANNLGQLYRAGIKILNPHLILGWKVKGGGGGGEEEEGVAR